MDNQEELEVIRERLELFGGYVLTCRKHNQDDWMEGLVDELHKVVEDLGLDETYKFNGDAILPLTPEDKKV